MIFYWIWGQILGWIDLVLHQYLTCRNMLSFYHRSKSLFIPSLLDTWKTIGFLRRWKWVLRFLLSAIFYNSTIVNLIKNSANFCLYCLLILLSWLILLIIITILGHSFGFLRGISYWDVPVFVKILFVWFILIFVPLAWLIGWLFPTNRFLISRKHKRSLLFDLLWILVWPKILIFLVTAHHSFFTFWSRILGSKWKLLLKTILWV